MTTGYHIHGQGKGILNAPTSLYSLPKCSGRDAYLSCPLSDGQGRVVINEEDILTGVVVLDKTVRCPITIIRFIVTVIVLTFNGMLRAWAWPHIFKEIWEAVPSFAYFYSPFAVVFKTRIVGIRASLAYMLPNNVFNRTGTAMYSSIRKVASAFTIGQTRITLIVGHVIKANSFNYLARAVEVFIAPLRPVFIVPSFSTQSV